MFQDMKLFFKLTLFAIVYFNSFCSFALNLKDGNLLLQFGGYRSSQGTSQFIGINGSIGNEYTVTQHHDDGVLLGLGYYLKGHETNLFSLSYGLDAYYLLMTSVKGNVIQERLFENLSYQYKVDSIPVYAAAKALLKTCSDNKIITLDFGIGPNFITTSHYSENSLDGGVTLPDNAFTGSTRVALSAMAGIGIRFNHVFNQIPLECGYRFFYLGRGQFNNSTNQLLNHFKTGPVYANAILCSVSI